jgi:ankyrin repeat protein
VKILLKAGVDPNAKKDGVYTPLCSSIRDNRLDMFHLLLANGADPNVPAAEYPCFKCVTHNRLHFLPHLVAAGGNLNSPKGIAETAVQHNNSK